MTRLVACGGTGAHVALALVRLHILGDALGFFDRKKHKFRFPDLYLVDQDSGDGSEGERTAWQEVNGLMARHPRRIDWKRGGRHGGMPTITTMSPLPVGEDKHWFDKPNNSLKVRFDDSPLLDLLTSRSQQEIDFSLGMMGSPAVGSLLFKLKEYDTADDGTNHDKEYENAIHECSSDRVVIVGSAVGGTGASVAPTLAELCAGGVGNSVDEANGADVMAVMVHKWFTFHRRDQDSKHQASARDRKARMKENAASGLACYGQTLVKKSATVLVGVPEKGLVRRVYTSDNQQPIQDSYAHVVGALAATLHLLKKEPFSPGLYGVSASDPTRLTGDLSVGVEEGTMQDLVDKATVLLHILRVFIRDLNRAESSSVKKSESVKNWLFYAGRDAPTSSLFRSVSDTTSGSQTQVARILQKVVNDYSSCLAWLQNADWGVKASVVDERGVANEFTTERRVAKRFKEVNWTESSGISEPEEVALVLYSWAARWVADVWNARKDQLVKPQVQTADADGHPGGYWPSQGRQTGLAPSWQKPGAMTEVAKEKQKGTLATFYEAEDISQNGWPDPVATAEHFKYCIEHRRDNPDASRQLNILLIGLANGVLSIEPVERSSTPPNVSLEGLIKDLQASYTHTELASHRIVYRPRNRPPRSFGFTSPKTLVCPSPTVSDDDWQELWEDLNDIPPNPPSRWNGPWNDPNDLCSLVKDAIEVITGWIVRLKKGFSPAVPVWASALAGKNEDAGPFSTSMQDYSVLWGDDIERTPLPRNSKSSRLTAEAFGTHAADKVLECATFLEDTDYQHWTPFKGFEVIPNYYLPTKEVTVNLIWTKHLEALQKACELVSWTAMYVDGQDKLFIRVDWKRSMLVKNLRVIDEKVLCIRGGYPLHQHPIPGSRRKAGDRVFPDLPVLPDYLGLVRTRDGNSLLKLLLDGVTDTNVLDIDQGPEQYRRGRDMVSWTVRFEGCKKPIRVPLRFRDPTAGPVRAHWMVWPNFRVAGNQDPWRAYYLYGRTSHEPIELRPMIVDGPGNRVSELRPGVSMACRMRAIAHDNDSHVGGPPVAVCAYDTARKEYVGVYLVRLTAYGRANTWKMAIDFGTSHTVAAMKVGEEEVEHAELAAELATPTGGQRNGMSVHISEDWQEGDPAGQDAGYEVWRPNYVAKYSKGSKSLLPSELWSVRPLDNVAPADINTWEPTTHYAIPVMDLRRPDVAKHILSGLKWGEIQQRKFRNKADILRKKYLNAALELFLADLVSKRSLLPARIQVTFTYPLRAIDKGGYKPFDKTIRKVLRISRGDLGCQFELVDNVGLFSESHAAKGGSGRNLEVVIVGDLGGGTFDMLISTSEVPSVESPRFREVADSAKLGGNLLLDILAKNPSRYLPKDSKGWSDDSETCVTQLRTWMRTIGANPLFDPNSLNVEEEGLRLSGFGKKDAGNLARLQIERYFRMITDYMAKSLVAYLGKEVWPKLSERERNRVRVLVQLRGNGWRLWYQNKDYASIQDRMRGWIMERAEELWSQVGMEDSAKPMVQSPAPQSDSPKLEAIRSAVGQSLGEDKAKKHSYNFPLSNLELIPSRDRDLTVKWYDSLPYKPPEDVENAVFQFGLVDPKIVLGQPGTKSPTVSELDEASMRKINEDIQRVTRDGGTIWASVAAQIWETVFESKNFQDFKDVS